MWKTSKLNEKSLIYDYLQSDRLYAAYAIGDLEEGLFPLCTWAVALRAEDMQALALHYRGLDPPALFLMGEAGGLRAILANELRPERVYFMCREEHLDVSREFYNWGKQVPMWRMTLQARHFNPSGGGPVRLTLSHIEQLEALYSLGEGGAFAPTQMQDGVFFGLFLKKQLVAAAGTHLVSPNYRVAAVGNVFTHPAYRGRGYGRITTSAVVAELLERDAGDIILNVEQDNRAAMRIYEKLGFKRFCPFYEGPANSRIN